MQHKHNLGIIWAVLLVSSILVLTVSCQKKTVAVEPGSTSTAQEQGPAGATSNTANAAGQTPGTSVAASTNRSDPVLREDVYFDFDKATLTPAARETLAKNGEWLRLNSDVLITIEGHCDQRGTNDYNLALGDRRAESVKTFLADLGIDRSRMTTISYGEERPADQGHGEAAWARNRRAHFAIR